METHACNLWGTVVEAVHPHCDCVCGQHLSVYLLPHLKVLKKSPTNHSVKERAWLHRKPVLKKMGERHGQSTVFVMSPRPLSDRKWAQNDPEVNRGQRLARKRNDKEWLDWSKDEMCVYSGTFVLFFSFFLSVCLFVCFPPACASVSWWEWQCKLEHNPTDTMLS